MHEFFGLNREPFSIAADPRFMYMSPEHKRALAHLKYGFHRGAGFILLTGEIGAGKTTVCRLFLRRLPPDVDVANVVNPRLSATALLRRVCEDLRVDLPDGTVDLIDAIHGHLLLADAQGRRSMIVVDEAQALAADVLEQLRLLSNLDSSGGKLQVFLIGQPELRTALQTTLLEPLAQRVVARFHLSAMPERETALYISHRLRVAGLKGPMPFEPEAIPAIHRLCAGVPRRINVLCDRAMHLAESVGSRTITRDMVERAAVETFDVPQAEAPAVTGNPVASTAPTAAEKRVQRWPAWAAIVTGALLLAGFIGTQHGRAPAITRPTTEAALTPPALTPPAPAPAPPAPAPPALTPPALTPPAPEPPAAEPRVSDRVGSVLPPTMVGAVEPARPTFTADALPGNADAGVSPHTILANTDEAEAWRALGKSWGVALPAVRPCAAAIRLGLRCYRGNVDLDLLRHLDRPGLMRIVNADGRTAFAEVTAISGDEITFRMGDARQNSKLASLAGHWHGEFSTLWRPPPGYRADGADNDEQTLTRWLEERLDSMGVGKTAALSANASAQSKLAARLSAFQLAHGLQPDGRLGPLTVMQIDHAGGIDEPRLKRTP